MVIFCEDQSADAVLGEGLEHKIIIAITDKILPEIEQWQTRPQMWIEILCVNVVQILYVCRMILDRKLKVWGIVPARYASTRFPGKVLAKLDERTMVEWVWRGASKAFDTVVVATDDMRVAEEVRRFGGRAVMTSATHESGTDRCAEAVKLLHEELGVEERDVVVNVQGDEPFVDPELLIRLSECFRDETTEIATVVRPFENVDDLLDPNNVKAVVTRGGRAVYFSRLPVPYVRGVAQEEWLKHHTFYWHVGLYAYRAGILGRLAGLQPSPLEMTERLEQNRWLENDFCVRVIRTEDMGIAVDTPEDLTRAQRWLDDKQR